MQPQLGHARCKRILTEHGRTRNLCRDRVRRGPRRCRAGPPLVTCQRWAGAV